MDFLHLIREKRRFLLSGHEHPDGDCLGAQVALHHLLRALGKQSRIVNPDPLVKSHDFLLRHTPFEHYRPEQPLPEADALLLLDCAHLSRLGALGKVLAATRPLIGVIDHHVGSEHGDGAVNLVDSAAAATGVLVHGLWRQAGIPLTPPAAEGVFVSLVADTGWFKYSNTDAKVLQIAADLVAAGVDPTRVYDALNRRNHADAVGLLAKALQTHEFRCGGRYVQATIDRLQMERAQQVSFDTDAVLEPLRSVEGVEVVGLFKERYDGAIKLSLRAVGAVDVQAIAKVFGGGRHKKAAGATLHLPMAKALALVEEQVAAAISALGPVEIPPR